MAPPPVPGVPANGDAAADPLAWLDARARERTQAGLRRRLVARTAGEDVLDLSGNDYLGLARDPRVLDAAADALATWGAGSTGSRLVTGTTTLHTRLESALAEFTGNEAALVFSSGYTANLGAVAALGGRGSLVVSDAYAHASLVDACRLSRARVVVVPHDDVDAVASALAGRSEERALVVTDAVFSVDGDTASLPALHAACRRYGAVLVADDAHGLGVCGPGGVGAVAGAGLSGQPDVVTTLTLSKSLGSQGGAVLGPRRVVDHLVDAARTMIFDTGLAPASVGAALGALGVLVAEPARPAALRRNAVELAARAARAGLAPAPPQGAVVGIPVGSPGVTVAAAAACREAGVSVGCFRPPSVPDGISRLRLTARADLRPADLDRAERALQAAAAVAAVAGAGAGGGPR